MADDITDDVQPDEGQGGDGQGAAPYQEWLDRIPESVRDDVEPVFRDWDANTTRKFQESSEYRKGWEPYEQLGVNQHDPGEVEWALQMLEAAKTNPQGVKDWFDGYAQQHGLTQAEQAQMQQEDEPYVDPSVSQLLEQQLSTHLGPVAQQIEELSQWRQAQEQQATEAHIQGEIRSELDSLKSKHGAEFDEGLVDKFIANHMHETDARVAVQKAFADAQSFRSQIEKQVLQSRVDNAATPPESGGTAAAGAEPITSLKEAGRIAAEQMREARRIGS